MFGPGAYRPDPTEGMTAIADLPPPEIVPYSRTNERQACPRCHAPGLPESLLLDSGVLGFHVLHES
jgi:hypothetical protein